MNDHSVHEDLARLRSEVERLAAGDHAVRRELDGIIGDIERQLAEPDADAHHGLLRQLRDAISRFETEHPRATAILNDIMVTLSNMGI